jgi:hypothetical protein
MLRQSSGLPRVNDRRVDSQTGQRRRFSSVILPTATEETRDKTA